MAILGPKSDLRLILYSFCCSITVFFYSLILCIYTHNVFYPLNSPHTGERRVALDSNLAVRPGIYPDLVPPNSERGNQAAHVDAAVTQRLCQPSWRPGEDYSGLRPSPLRGRRRVRRRLSALRASVRTKPGCCIKKQGDNKSGFRTNPHGEGELAKLRLSWKNPTLVPTALTPWRGLFGAAPLTPAGSSPHSGDACRPAPRTSVRTGGLIQPPRTTNEKGHPLGGLCHLAPWRGFEPLTPRLGGACSIL